MKIETKFGPKITLEIPAEYYRKLSNIKFASDNKRNHQGRPITNGEVYRCYRNLMEKLMDWLSDQVTTSDYRTPAFRIVGWTDNKVELQETDNPFDCYWTKSVIDHITDQFNFGGLSDAWHNDP